MEGTPQTNEELINAFREASQPRGKGPQGKQVPLTITHEIRLLRAQVESMEEELRGLQSKWHRQLKDDRVLATAQQSVLEKHAVAQAERVHEDLQLLLQQQQILFATLQAALHHAPLHSSGREMFEALHFNTQLGSDPAEREKSLLEHKKRSLATLPSIVNTFSQMAIDKALESEEDVEKSSSSMLPLSRIDITGCEDCTLVSSVFVTEIPHTSLEDVYAAVLAYFDAIPTSMKLHFGVEAKRRRLNDANSPVVYRCSTFSGGGLPSTVNNIVCSELTPSHGMVHIDAVTEDPLFPLGEESPLQYSICGLTITPCKEAITGKTLSVTLRWTVVYRYNMRPYDPAIKEDLEIIRPLLNGDLITASVAHEAKHFTTLKLARNNTSNNNFMSFGPTNVVMPVLPELEFLSSTSSSSDSDIADREIKKRRQVPKVQTEVTCITNGKRHPQRRTKGGLSAAHEVRALRAQVASMEEELRGLKLKWATTIPDENTLTAAYRSAMKKYAVIQTEARRSELHQMLMQHKFLFATLQTAVQRAPLYSTGKGIHDMIHFNTHLGCGSDGREEALKAHYKKSTTTLPAIINHITKVAIEKDAAQRGNALSCEPTTPLSQMEITGCDDGTLISSVFMSEIPHTTLEEVYAGVLVFFDSIPTWMKRHFGIDSTHTRLNRLDSPIIYWRSTLSGSGLPATVNHIVCSEITPSHAMVHMDAITDDPLNPVPRVSPLEYGICGLTITPRKDPITGKATSVTLRWAAVYRYKLLPDDPAIRQDLEIVRPILNGDLITSVVCEYINSKQQTPVLGN